MNISPIAPAAFEASAHFSENVFTASLQVSMDRTALRKTSRCSPISSRTPASLVDNTAKGFLSIDVQNVTRQRRSSKQGGPSTQTIAIPAALVATDTANGFDPTMISFSATLHIAGSQAALSMWPQRLSSATARTESRAASWTPASASLMIVFAIRCSRSAEIAS